MNILLNNNPVNFTKSEMSIAEIIEEKNFTFKMLVVKLNGILIEKENYRSALVKDGDTLVILHLISGG
ncbi:MAG: sulfur carrier protein ThiS [Bacteroidales bacterium]|nr:sulfur carrier protein ThiS [Bacteroidales bacterium]HOY38795.1 sulfur carrier protein ThiS [Bacteroidales bacterium]HQP03992.1 sulfur carrier protein ThiS [Bacteroidales bacterium]